LTNGDGDDHGICRADTARAHTQWRYLVASHKATDTLHQLTCLAPYLPGGMVVAITVESATLYYILNKRVIFSSSLTGWQLLALMSAKFLRSFFGDWYLQRFLSVVGV
jgi:hypothetical protein